MEKINEQLTKLADDGKILTVGVTAIAILIVGLCFILPVKRLNEFAKEHIFAIIIGAVLMVAASTIAQSLVTGIQE